MLREMPVNPTLWLSVFSQMCDGGAASHTHGSLVPISADLQDPPRSMGLNSSSGAAEGRRGE